MLEKSELFGQLIRYTVLGLCVSMVSHYFMVGAKTSEPSFQQCQELIEFSQKNQFQNWPHFHQYYLCEHSNQTTKLFHFLGTFNALIFVLVFVKSGLKKVKYLIFGIVQAYSFSWFSHFFVEQNKPAAFDYWIWSFISGLVMHKDLLFGNLRMY